LQEIGVLPGGTSSEAFGVSPDGTVIVGRARDGSGQWQAFRWSAETGMLNLGTLGGNWSEAWRTSADGSVITGRSRDSAGRWRAFRLDGGDRHAGSGHTGRQLERGTQYLARWCHHHRRARDRANRWRAFRWTEARGMENLEITYASLLSDGSELWEATALSPDGRYIVGWGYNAASLYDEAFLLDTRVAGDVDGNGCVDDADLLRVLFAFGQSGSGLPEDINGDRVVDDADLLLVLFNFGRGC
jgi:probable HAF family extracellular repeat protein